MFDILFWIAVGMIIGWNVFPQPTWVKAIYNRVAKWLKKD